MNYLYRNNLEKTILYIYLWIEAVIFFLILWAEHTRPYSVTGMIMYSAIVCNFFFILFFYSRYRGDFRIPLAMAVTMEADYLLTFLNRHFRAGVACFILVQIIYAWKIGFTKRNICLRLALFALFYLLLHFLGMETVESLLCAASMGILTGNVICSWKKAGDTGDSSLVMLAVGLTLFAGCDLCLGLRILTEGTLYLLIFHNIVDVLTWVFYLPSQVILCLCYLHEHNKKHHCIS